MNKKILLGSIIAVVILVLVSFISVVGYQTVQSSNQQKKLNEVTSLIKNGNEIKQKIDELKNLPCDCENDDAKLWKYPFICTILFGLFVFFATLLIMGFSSEIAFVIDDIGDDLGCYWSDILP